MSSHEDPAFTYLAGWLIVGGYMVFIPGPPPPGYDTPVDIPARELLL